MAIYWRRPIRYQCTIHLESPLFKYMRSLRKKNKVFVAALAVEHSSQYVSPLWKEKPASWRVVYQLANSSSYHV